MNKVNTKEKFEQEPVVVDKEKPTKKSAASTAREKSATRGDLVDLHKRMVEMFSTLQDGLGKMSDQKAAKDRLEICEQLNEMERSVNTMEGMLRIEMVPQFRAVLNDALEERRIGVQPRVRPIIVKGLFLLVGLGAGTFWSSEIMQMVNSSTAYLNTIFKG